MTINRMIDGLELFEAAKQQGIQQATACTEKARQEVADDWPEQAYSALLSYARHPKHATGEPWSGEDAVEFAKRQPGVGAPHDDRAFGSIFMRMRREGVIRRSPVSFPRMRGHASMTLGWETVPVQQTEAA